ncbi:hypothetical protein BV898_10489 [Hypsibius exemplaris]|uniref:Secreted protein n=1 Tax=Hypsibius exemplaris TaxID=2072580 RepID=A0A1W0WJT2_HYPEX|nr:hypothetical protein BV898_10489 [Hypsibius exemplaris]
MPMLLRWRTVHCAHSVHIVAINLCFVSDAAYARCSGGALLRRSALAPLPRSCWCTIQSPVATVLGPWYPAVAKDSHLPSLASNSSFFVCTIFLSSQFPRRSLGVGSSNQGQATR